MIHTLGPKTTDSYDAAMHIPGMDHPQIQLHPNFDEIIAALADYAGDQFLLPAAYQSARPDFGWRELCYEYSNQLALELVFHRPLQAMALIENPQYSQDAAIIHPATENLLRHQLGTGDYPVLYAGSKAQAYQEFLAQGYRYCITSANLLPAMTPVLARFEPDMVWCLYNILPTV
ncbi:hypothetical protein [Lacticaseibacillus sp. N501-2]|uniref:hypothetical protein n=1 Tax=Lacticaseibacillus salsurae TaxID=3367729 RepID=UPI0038B24B9B